MLKFFVFRKTCCDLHKQESSSFTEGLHMPPITWKLRVDSGSIIYNSITNVLIFEDKPS